MQTRRDADDHVLSANSRTSSRSSRGGSTRRLGAGRVMSHTLMAAVFFPFASSISGALPIGESSAASSAALSSAQTLCRTCLQDSVIKPGRQVEVEP